MKSCMCVKEEPVTDLRWTMAAGMQDSRFESIMDGTEEHIGILWVEVALDCNKKELRSK